MNNGLLTVILFLLCLNTVSAATFSNGSVLNASTNNITITFQAINVSADDVLVQGTYITMWNTTIHSHNGSVTCETLNFTTGNSSTDSALLPQFIAASANTRTIRNGLSQSCVATLNLSVGIVPSRPQVAFANGSSEALAYSLDGFGNVTVNVSSLPPGNSAITLNSVLPSVVNASVVSSSTTPDATLRAQLYVNDSTGLNVSVHYAWFTNGVLHSSDTVHNVSTNAVVNLVNITGAFSAGQTWVFSAVAESVVGNSSAVNTSSVYIDPYNTPSSGGGGGGSGGGSGGGGGGGSTVTNRTNTTVPSGNNTVTITPNGSSALNTSANAKSNVTEPGVEPVPEREGFSRTGWPLLMVGMGVAGIIILSLLWWVMKK